MAGPAAKAGRLCRPRRNRKFKRLGEDATPQQIREAVQRAWDSVDNRMGQLVYDNLFWNRDGQRRWQWHRCDLSAGISEAFAKWAEELKDTITLPLRVRRALKEGKAVEPIVTHRMAYVAALPIVTAIVGAMTQYLFTGKGPTELKDYFFPRPETSTKTAGRSGCLCRHIFATYMRILDIPEKTANTSCIR
jgi:hypothetical protein